MKLKVIAHPGSKHPRIDADLFNTLHVYVREPAIEGRANEGVVKALAARFGVAKSKVRLTRGARAKIKYFEIG